MTIALELHGIRKTFGSGATAYHALRGIDLSVSVGEFTMISGPSGSGKTTLLSILGCVLTATGGSLRMFGCDLSHLRESELSLYRLAYVGFVFQSHNLLSSLSAVENVRLPLELRGLARAEATREALALLARVDLSDRVDCLPRDLSGGQRQRVAIARALAGSPPLILADEPTAALDATNGMAAVQTLRGLAKKHGHTVIVVTHDSRIFELADRIIHIEDGLIQRTMEQRV
jgi:putative ABC transport system ATP-binding protein